jgi:hypothetical protein
MVVVAVVVAAENSPRFAMSELSYPVVPICIQYPVVPLDPAVHVNVTLEPLNFVPGAGDVITAGVGVPYSV